LRTITLQVKTMTGETKTLRFRQFVYNGADPAKALKTLLEGPITLECATAGLVCEYKALLDTIGPKAFNDKFANKEVAIGGPKSAPYKFEDDILPGSWVFFPNNANYPKVHKGGAWGGENTVYLGNDMFIGLGIGKSTALQVRQRLLEEYNKNLPKDAKPITIDDIPPPDARAIKGPDPSFTVK
jgi:protein-glutamine gamma-glutamyltransferase